MKKEEVNSEIDKTVDSEMTNADTIAETEEVVEATPVEATTTDDATDVVVTDTVTSEEFDAENQPVVPKKKKFKMKPWQIAVTAVAAVLLIIIIVLLSIVLPLFIYKPVPNVQTSEINGYYRVENFIATTSYIGDGTAEKGTSIKQADLFPDATSIVLKGNSNALEISGTDFIAKQAGKATVTVTPKVGDALDYEITVVEGVNVYNYAQLKVASQDESVKNIVLQSNIEFDTKSNGGDTIVLKANLYGNTHKVDGTNYTKDYEKFDSGNFDNKWTSDVMFEVAADNIQINAVHALGKDLKKNEGETWEHNEYADGGDIVDIYGHHGILIKNCVFEKAFKCVWLKESTVTIEGTLLREVADGCISMETTNDVANKLTLNNNIVISPQVAAIIIYNLGNKTPVPAELTINGFFDVYNWKNKDTAALMPITEKELASAVNNLIGNELDKPKYQPMMVADAKGDYWLHIAIVVLSSGGGGINEPKINGVTMTGGKNEEFIKNVSGKDGYVKRQLPFGSFGAVLSVAGIKTANMIGYQVMPETKELQAKNPNTVEINKDMFDKMYEIKK